jgi:hypothetical protein
VRFSWFGLLQKDHENDKTLWYKGRTYNGVSLDYSINNYDATIKMNLLK